jgi:hypothetical protein
MVRGACVAVFDPVFASVEGLVSHKAGRRTRRPIKPPPVFIEKNKTGRKNARPVLLIQFLMVPKYHIGTYKKGHLDWKMSPRAVSKRGGAFHPPDVWYTLMQKDEEEGLGRCRKKTVS